MKRIVAVIAAPSRTTHELMAESAIQDVCTQMGHHLNTEVVGRSNTPLSSDIIRAADVILMSADVDVDMARFAGKSVYSTSTARTIRNTREVLEGTLALAPVGASHQINGNQQPNSHETTSFSASPLLETQSQSQKSEGSSEQTEAKPTTKRIVAITSCPTGVAHTFMAAKALEKAAKTLGYQIKVETQGSVGAENTLSQEEIAAADAVVIAADVKIDLSRFADKAVFMAGTKDAMQRGPQIIESALAQSATAAATSPNSADFAARVQDAKEQRSAQRTGPYKHLMTGVSYMLPFVVAGGLCIALAFALGGIFAGKESGTLGAALSQIGGGTAFALFVGVLSAFIAYSIADRPGIAPGLIGGMLAQNLGAGFLGGIASGFMAGYLTAYLARAIKLPRNLEGLKPVLILPFLSTLVVGLTMIYVIAPPVAAILNAMTTFLNSIRGTNAAVLGLILGAMMAFDMGGPVNKAAYTFSVGLLASKVGGPMAAVIAAGMTPPLGLALAATLFPDRFDDEEREARGPALALGLAFITEGAIPFAAKDPMRVIPAIMVGSALTGAISMAAGVSSLVPHGGIFAAIIPGAFTGLVPWAIAIVVGTLVTTGGLWLLKRPVASPEKTVTVGTKA
ncbi:PTS fructose transporter subunit EIIBC [bacterium]|nr:MAG: PTS fructose transporter subunit EIIBC [bacterium]